MDALKRIGHIVMAKDKVRVSFHLYHGKEHGERVLIICPGFFQSKETAIFQKLSRELAQDQDVLCMDFRGHGRSSGLYTFSAKEGADLETVLKWAGERYAKISILGFSLGAATAVTTVSRLRDGIQGVVAVSCPAAFEEIEFKIWNPEAAMLTFQTWDPRLGCRPGPVWLKKERPLDAIRSLSPIPVLLIHGDKDSVVHHRHSQRLYQQAAEPKRMVILPGGGHAEEIYRIFPERFLTVFREGVLS